MRRTVTSPKKLPSREWLLARFDYDTETGSVIWKIRGMHDFPSASRQRAWNTNYAGTEAGSVSASGHRNVGFLKQKWLIHRVIWKMRTGDEPRQVDHKEDPPSDNRWCNIRDSSDVENKGNSRVRKNNSTCTKGVRFSLTPGKFTASMSQNGRKIHLGTFDTKEEAQSAYCSAAKEYFGEFWSDGKTGKLNRTRAAPTGKIAPVTEV